MRAKQLKRARRVCFLAAAVKKGAQNSARILRENVANALAEPAALRNAD